MTQVIADTTLLRYLIEIEVVEVLPVLFGQVITPPAVIHDLQHANTPDVVRTWIASPPAWLVIQAPTRRRTGADGLAVRTDPLTDHEHPSPSGDYPRGS